MNQPTLTDILRMEDVLADTRHILAEAEQVARGEKVKITFYPQDGKGPLSHCYPPRVANYARQVLGVPASLPEATRISFSFRGSTFAHLATETGYRALVQALLARSCAEQRRLTRHLRQHAALSQKGGQTGE